LLLLFLSYFLDLFLITTGIRLLDFLNKSENSVVDFFFLPDENDFVEIFLELFLVLLLIFSCELDLLKPVLDLLALLLLLLLLLLPDLDFRFM